MASTRKSLPPLKKRSQRNGSADAVFRAFSDRTRLRILHLLRQGELCVNDLLQVIDVPQPTASRHLAYLRRVGMVAARKHGQWVYYSLAPARSSFHRKLLDCLVSCFDEVPEIRQDTARAARVLHSGGCCNPLARS